LRAGSISHHRRPGARQGECNCSICTKKGFLHLIVPPEHFELLRGQGELTTYEFNTGTAKHTFCRHRGIHAFYVPRSSSASTFAASTTST
jgi:hypothetical protein